MHTCSVNVLGSLAGILLLAAACSPSGTAPASAPSAASPAPGGGSPVASPAATPYPRVTLDSPYTAISVSNAPLWVAKDEGIFDKYGIDAQISYLATSTNLIPSMLNGEVSIAPASEDAALSAGLAGADVVMVGAGTNRLLFSVFATPDLQAIGDLKGKRLGVTRFGASTDFAARYVLNKNNLKPGDDVTLVQMGGVPEIFTGLQTGALDAGMLSPPVAFTAQDAGLRVLDDVSEESLPFYQAAVVTRRSWLRDNHDVAVRYMKAFIEAIALIKKDPALTQKIVGKYANETNASILQRTIDAAIPILPTDQTPALDAVRVGLQEAALTDPKATDADPSQFIDTSVMQEIVNSGFLQSLGQ